ncbi:MAG TPA: hypothetical protein PKC37_01560 [Kaistella sp.]|uniref:hypothetical protein n=1 Tax=Candidatus Kaistella beijingensis TaxID=2820270 RepID=UPI0019F99466|nr:hypothetical protein [Candidatus Kaistella beijingensis]MBE2273143.1 hypothetical protein [Flavobacteriales bacterium]UBB90282.1 hypothetical protein J4771_02680 [Candidatus Kaistella beijingensis]HMU06565.1 hypothetical protein [Kaistella sp.]HQD44865.1 hypothetical protein [Kaistella sp.]
MIISQHDQISLYVSFLVFSINLFSQELYAPRNIKKAYEKQTRTINGKPGKNYWQNDGNYTIVLR